jgi:UDP-N-acetylglucosamine--N-acetylmuramyl-(pentapeptide) pyrophosphoryl-undecaprenol N-acetylglucosamine transferase
MRRQFRSKQPKRIFPGNAVVTGNPVRREFFEIKPKQRDRAKISLLLFGGSQGSRRINEAMMAALPHLRRIANVCR